MRIERSSRLLLVLRLCSLCVGQAHDHLLVLGEEKVVDTPLFRVLWPRLSDDPRLQELCIAAIKWAMGLVDANVTSRPLPSK
jgi:hypothetical protein